MDSQAQDAGPGFVATLAGSGRGRALRIDPKERASRRRAAPENAFRASLLKGPMLAASCASYSLIYPRRSLEVGGFELAHDMAKRLAGFFSRDQLAAIENLRDSRNMTYLHIQGMPLTGDMRFPSDAEELGRREFESQFHVTDKIAAGVLYLLNSECRSRYLVPGAPIVRTMITSPADAQVGDRDGLDMALRFHQSTVERALVGVAGPETCNFKVYACLRNRRRIPVFLLRVKDVIAALPANERDWVIKQLQRNAYEKSGPKYDLIDQGQVQLEQPILLRSDTAADDDWLMSFDPERVRTGDEDAKRAIRFLRLAMIKARKTQARRITPEEGDLLIVDNMRVMVSRREYDPQGVWDFATAMIFRKDTRMLRLYYGFPAPEFKSLQKQNRKGDSTA